MTCLIGYYISSDKKSCTTCSGSADLKTGEDKAIKAEDSKKIQTLCCISGIS